MTEKTWGVTINPESAGRIALTERFTDRAKKVCELALREALQLGHNYIGTEHILLGLLREGEGLGVRALARIADPVLIRQAVLDTMRASMAKPPTLEERVARLEKKLEGLAPPTGASPE